MILLQRNVVSYADVRDRGFEENLLELFAPLRVEGADRLVQKRERGVSRQKPGQSEQLLFSWRERGATNGERVADRALHAPVRARFFAG